MLDDNIDFANINIGKSIGLAKRKESPPSRKIIIATNKNDISIKKKIPVKPDVNENMKVYNMNKEKKITVELAKEKDKAKTIKYNFSQKDLPINKRNEPDTKELSTERMLTRTMNTKSTAILMSPSSSHTKGLSRGSESETQMSSTSSVKLMHLSRDKDNNNSSSHAHNVNVNNPSATKEYDPHSIPLKMFKKNFSKQDEK